jgi:aryl-alcohol dehydrogenase-like predicted oxidoreductase
VRLGGVSNFGVSLLERCEAIRHVDSLQPPFLLIKRQAAAIEIPWCARHNTGVICYSPMQSGLLTDTFSRQHVARFAADDWRRRSPDFNDPNLSRNLALRDALRPIAQRTAPRCPPERLPGCWRGPALLEPLLAAAHPSKSTAGSGPHRSN